MVQYLHYHAWDIVRDRISRAGNQSDPFDKIARKDAFDTEIIGATIWGITKHDGEWYFTGKLIPTWVGKKSDIPEGVSPVKIQGKENYATCPSADAVCEHGLYGPLEGIGSIPMPSFEGKTLDEVAKNSMRLRGFFHQIDTPIEFDDWEPVPL